MENVYDIKREKGLNYILPLNDRLEIEASTIETKRVLIIVHLHYLDMLDSYLSYIENIPKRIDIFFTVSDKKIREAIEKRCDRTRNYKIIEKKNRGRDISAFLVACRKEILKYEYVCFLHDKKEKDLLLKNDIKKWNQCLWENMIGSREYIDNILDIFFKNPKLGLLVPPLLISEHISFFYCNMWAKDFLLTKNLAKKMELNCVIEKEKPPITLGTVFWAKVSALKKLFEIEWKYEDFDEEPLADDGTISHAIERILAYVAQDAGFDTGWVMNDRFAGEQTEYIRIVLNKAFERLGRSLDIWNEADLNRYEGRLEKLLKFVNDYEHIYIYGAGTMGKKYATFLRNRQKCPEAFLVSDKNDNVSDVEGVPVYAISEIELDDRCGIIIGVSDIYQKEVLETIKEKEPTFCNIYFYHRI